MKSILVELNVRQQFTVDERVVEAWTKEEIVLTQTEILSAWVHLYKTDEARNNGARNRYYIGEPVLAKVTLRDRDEEDIRWFPLGADDAQSVASPEKPSDAPSGTAFGRAVLAFVQQNRPVALRSYQTSLAKEKAWMESLSAVATSPRSPSEP